MKKALILQDGRITEVADKEFPVHPDLKWIDVPDDTTTRDTFDGKDVQKEVAPQATPFVSLVDRIIADKDELAKLKAALK